MLGVNAKYGWSILSLLYTRIPLVVESLKKSVICEWNFTLLLSLGIHPTLLVLLIFSTPRYLISYGSIPKGVVDSLKTMTMTIIMDPINTAKALGRFEWLQLLFPGQKIHLQSRFPRPDANLEILIDDVRIHSSPRKKIPLPFLECTPTKR